MKTADKSKEFEEDVKNGNLMQFLLKTLLFTCVESQNHIRNFVASDGRTYKNEICLDNSNGETLATIDLQTLNRTPKEQALFTQWKEVFHCAKVTANYDTKITYGVYQITEELNTFEQDEGTGERVYHYPELNGHLITLKALAKNYYLSEIVPTLFKYELLK